MRKGSSLNRNVEEIWYREAVQGPQQRHHRRHLQARGISNLKITKSFEARTWPPVAQDTQQDLTKSETMDDSQVRHSDASSMASTGGPVAWSSDQMVKSQASTGRPVTDDSITDIDLEATKEYNILSAGSTSFREKVNERVRARLNRDPGDEVEEIDKHSLI